MPQDSRGSRGAGRIPSLNVLPRPRPQVGARRPSTRSSARRPSRARCRTRSASGRIGHAFLLSGARGVGKTTTARILAKALNCSKGETPTPEPCGECASCVEIAAGTSLDVQEIDGATHNGVDQVRELRESARYNPARDRFKIWIIDEVHMLSTAAFNALLKTLEEPPPRVKFIFATTEYHKIPDTILSRCQQYDFRMIPARELLAHLREVADARRGSSVSDEALAPHRARRRGQRARRAVAVRPGAVLQRQRGAGRGHLGAAGPDRPRAAARRLAGAAAAGDTLALLELVERLSDYGADYRNFTRELLLHFREILLLKLAPGRQPRSSRQIVPEERERLRPLAEAFSEEDLLRSLRRADPGRDRPALGPGPARHAGAGAAEARRSCGG